MRGDGLNVPRIPSLLIDSAHSRETAACLLLDQAFREISICGGQVKSIERMMVPTDCSAGADAAAEVAAQLARRLHASVDVVTVVDTSTFNSIYGDEGYRHERIRDIHGRAQNEAELFATRHFRDLEGIKVHVRDGNVFLEILQAAQDLGSDMIVMGTHGRTGVAHLLIGSITEKVVRKSTVPVLAVRAPH
jgi:nucleotide-binding universal stress UspA family protein